MLSPETIPQLLEIVRENPCVLPVGNGTKPGPEQDVPDDFTRIGMSALSGIIEYDPSEFTITVLTGTPLAEIGDALAENRQYLPFDPPLAAKGATIGGTVATGLSGPGAYRFGPIRDFLIGVKFIDGEGNLVSGGGKVVKNAAGFDFPKFLIGSCGRLGVLVELTFKVFPRPEAEMTVGLPVEGTESAVDWIGRLSRGPYDAITFEPDRGIVAFRMSGHGIALQKGIDSVDEELPVWPDEEADFFWSRQQDFGWADPDAALAKFPVTPSRIMNLEPMFSRADPPRMYGLGGNVLYLSAMPSFIEKVASKIGPGLILRSPGDHPSPWVGRAQPRAKIEKAVKVAIDPTGKFPTFD
ncbi:MAG: FAD-binding protein [Verrucomicrobiales bacterium]|nr:FAD-binding protein [Verrucomicrobiales bacterium]